MPKKREARKMRGIRLSNEEWKMVGELAEHDNCESTGDWIRKAIVRSHRRKLGRRK